MKPHTTAVVLGWMAMMAPVWTSLSGCFGSTEECQYMAGRVVDAETGDGIEGILISCLEGGSSVHETYSGKDGAFSIWYQYSCASLRFEDLDGIAAGGDFVSRTVDDLPSYHSCRELSVALQKK